MAPNQTIKAAATINNQTRLSPNEKDTTLKADDDVKVELVWLNVVLITVIHLIGLNGLRLLLTGHVSFLSFIFYTLYAYASGTAITGGAHRLWAHKSYKARWPLRLLLAYFQAAAFQNSIYEWVRDHRVHHKFCDTNADPHNSNRGFFFSHMGWLMMRKHKDVMEKGKTVDMSDLEKDWVVMFQKKYFTAILIMCWLVMPTLIPWYFWGEDIWVAYCTNIFRYIWVLHNTWCVNSLAHMWGDKPFDKKISASNNLFVAIGALGEGWHNYHHCFPWDYRASEVWNINSTTKVINFFAKIGWAYDLKVASDDLIRRKALRSGNSSGITASENGGKIDTKTSEQLNKHSGELWGFDDKDMTQEERSMILIKNIKTQ